MTEELKDLKELKPGDDIRMKIQDKDKEWAKAKVVNKLYPRSYTARTEEGMLYRRNRRHIMETKEKFSEKSNEYSAPEKDALSKKTINERKIRQFHKETVNSKNTVTNENANTTTIAAEHAENSSSKNPKVATKRNERVVRRPQFCQAV